MALRIGFDIKRYIRIIPDYPKPGILFRDITTLLADLHGFRAAVDEGDLSSVVRWPTAWAAVSFPFAKKANCHRASSARNMRWSKVWIRLKSMPMPSRRATAFC